MAQTTAAITDTSSCTLTKPASDTLAVFAFYGTYGTVTLVFEGTIDGTNYFPVGAVAEATGAVVTGTVSLVDNSTAAYKVPCEGTGKVRARVTAIASGELDVAANSAAYVGLPSLGSSYTSGGTFSGVTLSGTTTVSGALAAASSVLSTAPTGGGVGYATGAGGAVTQATDRTTGVTLSKLCGAITTNNASLAAGAEAEFTVTNTTVAATDVVVVCLKTESTTGTSVPYVSTVGTGSFKITLSNLHASTADTSASVINFCVIKAVAS